MKDIVLATPEMVLIGTLPHPNLRLKEPICARVSREGRYVLVASDDFLTHGIGGHLTEAIEDFQQSVLETYGVLKDDQDRLGPAMEDLWSIYQDRLVWRP